jgi:hypothetical protein
MTSISFWTTCCSLITSPRVPSSATRLPRPHGEIVDNFTFFETDALELRPQPLRPCVPDNLATDPQRPDCLPRLCGGHLHRQRCQHLLRHRAGDGVQRHSVFLQRDISGLDGLPEVPRLQLDLHDQHPLCVVRLGEKWPVCWSDANFPHNSLTRTAVVIVPT